jgi:hypothetical protein
MKPPSSPKLTFERRFLAISTEERAAVLKPETRTVCGYAALFNSLSEDLGGFREIILPGAFTKSIEDGDIRCLVDHDSSKILGRKKSGTLRLKQDERGLWYEADLPDTSYANDLVVSLTRKDVDGSSFGFRAVTERWEMRDGMPVRILSDLHCFDVSPVTYPAYLDTSSALRSLEEFRSSLPSPNADHQNRFKRAALAFFSLG